jgi:2-amino-4-hydroxy-6-hydroxymethyldihydropteridine diphosphokinase
MNATQVDAFIALGSNVGDRRATMTSALDALRRCDRVRIVEVSDIMETDPVGPPGQGPYLNAVAWVSTDLEPHDLMTLLLDIERLHGRTRSPDHRWGPRTLDLDLILYGDQVIDQPGLTVPHPQMHQRTFVLKPLVQIAPGRIHPVLGRTIAELLDSLSTTVFVECKPVQTGL